MEIPTHQYRPTTYISARIDPRIADQPHPIAKHLHRAALVERSFGFDHAISEQGSTRAFFPGLNGDFTALRAIGGNNRGGFKRDVLLGPQKDLPSRRINRRRIGTDRSAVAHRRSKDAYTTRNGNQFADVERFRVSGGKFDAQVRTCGLHQFDALAGRKNDFSCRTGNDAVIFDIGRHQIHRATVCVDGSLIDDFPGADAFFELEFTREKITV